MILDQENKYKINLDLDGMELQLFDKRIYEGQVGFENPVYDLNGLSSIQIITPGGIIYQMIATEARELPIKEGLLIAILFFKDGDSVGLKVDLTGYADLVRLLYKSELGGVKSEPVKSKRSMPLTSEEIKCAERAAAKRYTEDRLNSLAFFESITNLCVLLAIVLSFFGGLHWGVSVFILGDMPGSHDHSFSKMVVYSPLIFIVIMLVLRGVLKWQLGRKIDKELGMGLAKLLHV